MKFAAVILLIGLFACSNAALFDSTSDFLAQLLEKAKANINTPDNNNDKRLQDISASLLSKLLVGKRDLGDVRDFFQGMAKKFHALIEHGKAIHTSVFKSAMDKLKAVAEKFHKSLASLTDSKEAADEVDDIVDEHNAVQKRFIGDLFNKAKEFASSLLSKAKAALSTVVSTVVQKGADLLVGKRAINWSDGLKALGGHLQNLVSPFKDVVSGLGATLKGHFSNLVESVKGHAVALGNKLKGHVSDLAEHGSNLLEHGKNALSAVSEVVSDVLKQTISNVKPSIDGAAKTVVDAGKVLVDHFANGSSN